MNTEEKIWDLTQAINVKGVWYGCKHAVLAMRENKDEPDKGLHQGGSVINVASFVAKLGAATPQLAYTASKGAVLAMTRELAMIHAREGIRFNALCPGPIRTPLLMDFLNTPEKLNRRMIHCPMGRFGEAVEQAKAVVFRECIRWRWEIRSQCEQFRRTHRQAQRLEAGADTQSHPTTRPTSTVPTSWLTVVCPRVTLRLRASPRSRLPRACSPSSSRCSAGRRGRPIPVDHSCACSKHFTFPASDEIGGGMSERSSSERPRTPGRSNATAALVF